MSQFGTGQLQYALAAALLLIGVYGMLVKTNFARKLMAKLKAAKMKRTN